MKIKGKALWASVQAPNTKYDPVYQIDLVIEDAQVAGAKKAGLKVKKTDDGNVIRFRRNQFRATGEENKKPVVVDATNRPMADLVGNGSLVNVQFTVFEYDNKFGKGTGSDLQGVQVLELVTYGGQDGDEFEVEAEDNEFANEGKPKAPAPTADFDDDIPDVL